MKNLRPYQAAAVEQFMARDDKRLLLHHATGAGKTRTAIECAKAMGAQSVLVVAPALARPIWRAEFAKWWPDVQAHSIKHGRTRSGLTKKQVVERELAYNAQHQIVSYDLCHHIDNRPRDLVVIDELHNLGNPQSKQSRTIRTYFRHSPPVAALGLTATLYRTEVKQLWAPVDTLWPGYLGKPSETGNISWSFLNRFTQREQNEYGTHYHHSRALPELRALLQDRTSRVTEHSIAAFLPPLRANVLYCDVRGTLAATARDWFADLDGSAATDDLDATQADTKRARHVGVFCYYHDSQENLVKALTPLADGRRVFVINGSLSVERRAEALAEARASAGSIVCATVESVNESISLSFLKAALVFEWQTSPASAVQFLGRFPRPDTDDMSPTKIDYVCFPGDEGRAATLEERIQAVNRLSQADQKSEVLEQIFAPRPLTDVRLDAMFASMMGSARMSLSEGDSDDGFSEG